jgi:hypothetical protein
VPIVRQHCSHVLLETVPEEQRSTARCQHPHDLMDHALGHGQRPVPGIDRQEQFAHRIDGPPHPMGRARQALEHLGLAHFTSLHGTEQGEEFIELHLRDPHVVHKILGKGRSVVCHLQRPGQDGIGVDLEHPSDGTDPQALGERSHRPDQHLG